MSAERDTLQHELLLSPGQVFRPFEGVQPLESDQGFYQCGFNLEGIGRGSIDFERTHDSNVELFVDYLKQRGIETVTPFGPIAVYYVIEHDKPVRVLTPCELTISFSLPIQLTEPFPCIFELPSLEQSFVGLPQSTHNEETWLYDWYDQQERKVVPLFPNEGKVLEKITLRFIKPTYTTITHG